MSKILKFYPSKTVYFHLDRKARAKQMIQGFNFRKTIKVSKNPRSSSFNCGTLNRYKYHINLNKNRCDQD